MWSIAGKRALFTPFTFKCLRIPGKSLPLIEYTDNGVVLFNVDSIHVQV